MDMLMTVMMYFPLSCLHGNAYKFVGANDFINFQECILTAMKSEICMTSPFCDKYSGNAFNLCNCAGILDTLKSFPMGKG